MAHHPSYTWPLQGMLNSDRERAVQLKRQQSQNQSPHPKSSVFDFSDKRCLNFCPTQQSTLLSLPSLLPSSLTKASYKGAPPSTLFFLSPLPPAPLLSYTLRLTLIEQMGTFPKDKLAWKTHGTVVGALISRVGIAHSKVCGILGRVYVCQVGGGPSCWLGRNLTYQLLVPRQDMGPGRAALHCTPQMCELPCPLITEGWGWRHLERQRG